jgi:hypothetical protein
LLGAEALIGLEIAILPAPMDPKINNLLTWDRSPSKQPKPVFGDILD